MVFAGNANERLVKHSAKTPISACDKERLAKISLICCDMDGTWLSPEHGPTSGGLKALAEASRTNVFFCDGTMPKVAAEASVHYSKYQNLLNGAVVLGEAAKSCTV